MDLEWLETKMTEELLKIVMVDGYEEAKCIYNQLSAEDKEIYKEDFEKLRKVLVSNYNILSTIKKHLNDGMVVLSEDKENGSYLTSGKSIKMMLEEIGIDKEWLKNDK